MRATPSAVTGWPLRCLAIAAGPPSPGVSRGHSSLSDECLAAGVLLETAVSPAAAPQASGLHPDMPDLGREPPPAAQQPPVEHDASADAGADGHTHHVVAAPGAEAKFTPGRRVGVVLYRDRQATAALDFRPQLLVPPGQV